MSDKRVRRIKQNHSDMAGSVINKHVSSDTQGVDNSSENTMVNVKLEKQEEAGLFVTCGIHKRKRLSRGKSGRFAVKTESSLDLVDQKIKQPRITTRWNTERLKRTPKAFNIIDAYPF